MIWMRENAGALALTIACMLVGAGLAALSH